MQVTIKLPESTVVEIRKQPMAVEFAKFVNAEEFVRIAFEYGLGRFFNDKSSPAGEKAPAKDSPEYAAFAKRCLENAIDIRDAAYAGEYVRTRGPAKEPADPVAKEAWRIAGEIVTSGLGRMWKNEFKPVDMAKVKAFAAKHELDLSDMEAFLDAAREIVAKTDRVVAQAKELVLAKSALADLI